MSDAMPSEEAFLQRARSIAGRTVAEVASRVGVSMPAEPRRAKGFVGELVERALGIAPAPGVRGPDVPALGLELKTIPVRTDGRPRESTYVCTVALARIEHERWETSDARAKLARVLWVPVEHDVRIALGERRFGSAFLWSPTEHEDACLRADWEHVQLEIARGALETIDARAGRALQVRPKARDGSSRVRAFGHDDAPIRVMPRGFYLRATFTREIVAARLLSTRDGRDPTKRESGSVGTSHG